MTMVLSNKREMVDHLLLHCETARILWQLLFTFFSVLHVLPVTVRNTFHGLRGFCRGEDCSKAWKAAPIYLFWFVWKVRNRIAFNIEIYP